MSPDPKAKLEPQHLIIGGLALVWIGATVALAGFAWQQFGESKPVKTTVIDHPLGWTFLLNRIGFLTGETTDDGANILGLQVTGRNNTGKFMGELGGFVRSERNGKTYPLFVGGRSELEPIEGFGIPGGNQFHIKSPYFDGHGLSIFQFLSEFGQLTFEFQYGGVTDRHIFSADEVEAEVLRLEDFLRPKPRRGTAGMVRLNKTKPNTSDDAHQTYRDSILNTAIGFRDGIMKGRLDAAKSRWDSGDWERMVRSISTQRVHCPNLVDADKTRLSPKQIQLISQYQAREDELELYIKTVEEKNLEGSKVAESFHHRLKQLGMKLDALIADWNADDGTG